MTGGEWAAIFVTIFAFLAIAALFAFILRREHLRRQDVSRRLAEVQAIQAQQQPPPNVADADAAVVVVERPPRPLPPPPISPRVLAGLDEADFCKVCFERPRNVVFEPCNHCVACTYCAALLQYDKMPCPICRCDIEGATKMDLFGDDDDDNDSKEGEEPPHLGGKASEGEDKSGRGGGSPHVKFGDVVTDDDQPKNISPRPMRIHTKTFRQPRLPKPAKPQTTDPLLPQTYPTGSFRAVAPTPSPTPAYSVALA